MPKINVFDISYLDYYHLNSENLMKLSKLGNENKVDELEVELDTIRDKQQKKLPDMYETNELDDDVLKEELLIEIKMIQGSLERTSVKQERIVRSRQLVNKLKSLYKHECQLCDPENPVLPIVKENRLKYVEVHHITSISFLNSAEQKEDIENIDTYENTIVVCPQHHMRLHYHQGGTRILQESSQELGFTFKNGEKDKLYLNHHLKGRD
ncbi:HNH endonuclease [Halobacillus trueperi]|uniref:HNH nuclease domain-containing protein n=1 Tax=Halobacillus trueperi TaxID=156205 RepID=A0A3E0J4Q9_9BACI|nr:HNH endonuclease [Halobacillus trueperi]REJ07912.1 hypothetical protein DYE48_14825 [Halobacillus trueperi]